MTYQPRGSYSVADECLVCHVLVAPGSHAEHEATQAHKLNVDPLRQVLARIARTAGR